MLEAIRAQIVDRLAQLQVQEADASLRLQAILGDKTLDEFIAGKQAEAVRQLQHISDLLTQFLTALLPAASASATAVPGYQHGTAYVPYTGRFDLHQAEMVLSAPMASRVRAGAIGGISVSLGGITVHVTGGDAGTGQRVADTIVKTVLEEIKFGKLRKPLQDLARRA